MFCCTLPLNLFELNLTIRGYFILTCDVTNHQIEKYDVTPVMYTLLNNNDIAFFSANQSNGDGRLNTSKILFQWGRGA